MKKTGIVLTILMIALLIAGGFAMAVSGSSNSKNSYKLQSLIFEDEPESADLDDYVGGSTLDAIDVFEVEKAVESEAFEISPEDVSYRKMVQVQGITYDDKKVAALINGIFLTTGVYVSEDSEIQSLTKGKLKIGGKNFDLERVGNADDSKGTFKLRGPSGISGMLEITLQDKYNEGRIKVWTGTLVIDELDYKGKVTLYTSEKLLKAKKDDKKSGSSKSIGNGVLKIGGVEYTLESVGLLNEGNLDFYVNGIEGISGKLVLRLQEKVNDDGTLVYDGILKIIKAGDEGDKEVIYGDAKATLKRIGANKFEGTIVVTEDDDSEDEDKVLQGKLSFSLKERKATDDRFIGDRTTDDDSDDDSASEISTSRGKGSAGFFARIWERIFG